MAIKNLRNALLLMAVSVSAARAQESGNTLFSKAHWSVFAAGGGQNYLGDFLPRKYDAFGATYDFKPSFKLGAEYQAGSSVRVRLAYFGTRLSGDETRDFQKMETDEQWRKSRALSFTNQIHELSLSGIWDILGFRQARSGEVFHSWITPYAGIGVGYVFMNPVLGDTAQAYQYAQAQNSMDYYNRDMQKAPLRGTVVFPVMVGARWQFSPRSSVFAELSRHFLTTDYLDRIGNWNTTQKNDGYMNYAIGYRYNLAAESRTVKL